MLIRTLLLSSSSTLPSLFLLESPLYLPSVHNLVHLVVSGFYKVAESQSLPHQQASHLVMMVGSNCYLCISTQRNPKTYEEHHMHSVPLCSQRTRSWKCLKVCRKNDPILYLWGDDLLQKHIVRRWGGECNNASQRSDTSAYLNSKLAFGGGGIVSRVTVFSQFISLTKTAKRDI